MLLGSYPPPPQLPPCDIQNLINNFYVFSFLQAGLCAPSQQSLTAGPSSNEGAVSEAQNNQSIDTDEKEDQIS